MKQARAKTRAARMDQRSTYYHTCPACGANLDPDERCDCTDDLLPAFEQRAVDDERSVER